MQKCKAFEEKNLLQVKSLPEDYVHSTTCFCGAQFEMELAEMPASQTQEINHLLLKYHL